MDRNLLHISYEGGILEDPWRGARGGDVHPHPAPELAPDSPGRSIIGFEAGDAREHRR